MRLGAAILRSMRASIVRGLLAAAVAAGAASFAAAQEPAPVGRSSEPMSADAHRTRGILAWQRAVWTSDAASYRRAAEEMDAARRLAPGTADVTTTFVLGSAWARAGEPAEAAAAVNEGRALAPTFVGHLLTEAVAQTGSGPGWKLQDGTRAAISTLDRYLVALATYPAKAPFATELRYLGLLERGMRLAALDEHDRALRDLEAALALARGAGRTPSAELIRMIAQCHKSLSQFELAENFLAEALHRDPGGWQHHHMLALVAADANRRDEAALWNRRAIARKIDAVPPRSKLAYLAWEAGDLDAMRRQLEAITHLQQFTPDRTKPGGPDAGAAANVRSGWGTYWLTRGERASESGDAEGAALHWRRARAEFEAALESEPGCIRAIVRLVEVLTRLQAPGAEVEAYRKRLEDMRAKKPDAPSGYSDTFC